jgi:hypothetical protein
MVSSLCISWHGGTARIEFDPEDVAVFETLALLSSTMPSPQSLLVIGTFP